MLVSSADGNGKVGLLSVGAAGACGVISVRIGDASDTPDGVTTVNGDEIVAFCVGAGMTLTGAACCEYTTDTQLILKRPMASVLVKSGLIVTENLAECAAMSIARPYLRRSISGRRR